MHYSKQTLTDLANELERLQNIEIGSRYLVTYIVDKKYSDMEAFDALQNWDKCRKAKRDSENE